MGFLSDIFKRKPGGTFVGNAIRSALHGVSGGLLGNGLFRIPAGGSAEQTNVNAQQAIGAGLYAANQYAPRQQFDVNGNPVQKGAFQQFLRQWGIYILAGVFFVGFALKSLIPTKRRR